MDRKVYILLTFLLVLAKSVECGHPGENDVCPEENMILSAPSGQVEAPVDNSTGKYPPDVFCVWELDLPEDKFVTLKFTSLDVELSGGCNNDRVEIYDAGDSYQRYCGSELPAPITLAAKDRIYINFISDDFLHYSGFRLEYEVTDKPGGSCEGLVCRNLKCVSAESRCDGLDQCGDGTDEQSCPNSSTGDEFDSVPDPSCGVRPAEDHREHLNRVRRVVGGQVAKEGTWPWMISFQNSYSFPSGHLCGGALLNHRWVITAAHCVSAVPMVQQKIFFGSYRRYEEVKGQVTRYPEKNCVHPMYKRDTSIQNDIALIKLSVPVNYSKTIGPICLPKPDSSLPKSCLVTGWGRTQGTGDHDVLKEVEVPVLSREDCGWENEFCLLDDETHSSPCYGDSGGPVVQSSSGRWQLFGLISRGAEICGFRTDPTVCTQVSKYIDWITEQMEADFQGKPMNCRESE